MKRQIFILFLLTSYLTSSGQKALTTTIPCTMEMANKVKGRWISQPDLVFEHNAAQRPEMVKRLDMIQKIVSELYPEPIGVDAVWHRTLRNGFFGSRVKEDVTRDGVRTRHEVNGIPVTAYYYLVGFFRFFCNDGKENEIIGGWPGETNTTVRVYVNSFDFYASGTVDDPMNIDGRPIRMRGPVTKNLKGGYELLHADENSSTRSVLIHRKGIRPYIPVTRKQYLEHSIQHLGQMLDKFINDQKAIPVRSLAEQEAEKKKKLEKFEKDFGKDPKRLKSAVDYYLSGYQTEQQQRDERVKVLEKNKEDILNHYRYELEQTTKDGLLEAPAIVRVFHSPDARLPIFYTESEGGHMLVTENPAYIKKDLPKYVPQFMILHWSWTSNPPETNLGKLVEENFPIEKLQAMIDQ